jgi:hypothetical protein
MIRSFVQHSVAARRLRDIRKSGSEGRIGGLRTLYRTFDLPGRNPLRDAHRDLDEAALAAYGFSHGSDVLASLLALNHEVAGNLRMDHPVVAPGVPPNWPDVTFLITGDRLETGSLHRRAAA